jgi:peptidoglycan hydrolase CwlO-like protein
LTQVWAYLLAQEEIINKIGERQVATQSDVDALTAALAQEDSDLNAAVSGIQAEIDSLKAANPSLDLSALSAQVDATKAAVAAAAALVPAPAAPPADGGSAPSA